MERLWKNNYHRRRSAVAVAAVSRVATDLAAVDGYFTIAINPAALVGCVATDFATA